MLDCREELPNELRRFPNEIAVLHYASLAGSFVRKDAAGDLGDKYLTSLARLASDSRFDEKEIIGHRKPKSRSDTYAISESGKRNLKIYFDTNNENKEKLDTAMKKIMGARVLGVTVGFA